MTTQKSLPPGVDPTNNEFDFFEMYKLNGPPARIGLFANQGKASVDASEVAAQMLVSMLQNEDKDYSKIPPFMEWILVVEWDNGQSYHIRFPEVVAGALFISLREFFEGQGMMGLALLEYTKSLSALLYDHDGVRSVSSN